MVWTKVCGVTDRAAAESAAAAGADALGFQLVESPRQLTVEDARVLSRGLDVERVVLLDEPAADVALRVLDRIGATSVQPYGPAALSIANAASREGYLVLWPIAVRGTAPEWDMVDAAVIPLLDTFSNELAGGTGQAFDWALADEAPRPFVLAGGLGPDNVAEAVARVRPWGVDASSRLESTAGRKDPALVRDFVEAAKRGAPTP